MVYSDLLEDKIDRIAEALQQQYPGLKNYRWLAIKELEQDREVCAKYPVDILVFFKQFVLNLFFVFIRLSENPHDHKPAGLLPAGWLIETVIELRFVLWLGAVPCGRVKRRFTLFIGKNKIIALIHCSFDA